MITSNALVANDSLQRLLPNLRSWFRGLLALAQNPGYAFRTFRRNPGFALAAVLILALGIAANGAVFTVVNAILLRPLPFHHPQQLACSRKTAPAAYPKQSIRCSQAIEERCSNPIGTSGGLRGIILRQKFGAGAQVRSADRGCSRIGQAESNRVTSGCRRSAWNWLGGTSRPSGRHIKLERSNCGDNAKI